MSQRFRIRRSCAEIRAVHGRKGFTLVEVLLALAISGLLLTAATSLLITLSRAWAERPATRDAFDAHVDGVARFFVSIMDKATMAPGSENAKVLYFWIARWIFPMWKIRLSVFLFVRRRLFWSGPMVWLPEYIATSTSKMEMG